MNPLACPSTLRSATLRVLAAVLGLAAAGERLTVRAVQRRARHHSASGVHGHLVKLRRAGLVAYTDGAYGTLRVRCVIAKE